MGGALAIITGIALSLWLSVNGKRLRGEGKIETGSFLALIGTTSAWSVICACGAIDFVTRNVNWGSVVAIVIILAIIVGGGFGVVWMRAAQVKGASSGEAGNTSHE